MRVYPAIDLLEGRCVRLKQGGFDRATVYADDPLATARAFAEAGAEALHLVDLSGARNPAERQRVIISDILKSAPLRVQVGGGLRTLEDAAGLLGAGADRVVFGSAILSDPSLAPKLFREFGATRITLALDARIGTDGVARVASHGWKEQGTRSVVECLRELVPQGLQRMLCTDIGRDGMLAGPNVALYAALVAEFPRLEVQASGGVGSLRDLLALKAAGAGSAIVGKALYEGALDLREAILRC